MAQQNRGRMTVNGRPRQTGDSRRKTTDSRPPSIVRRPRSAWLWPGILIILIGACLIGASPAQAQAASDTLIVTVTVLDENSQPAALLLVELVLFEYAESTELVFTEGCVTDENGSCAIEVSHPPHVDGWIEGRVSIEHVGQRYVGWQMSEKRLTEAQVTLQLLPGNLMATLEPLLHPPFDEQPAETDMPLAAQAETARAATRTVTSTAAAPPRPTETGTPESTPTATLASTATNTPAPSPSPDEPQTDSAGLCWIGLGLFLAVTGLFLGWRTSRKAADKQDHSA